LYLSIILGVVAIIFLILGLKEEKEVYMKDRLDKILGTSREDREEKLQFNLVLLMLRSLGKFLTSMGEKTMYIKRLNNLLTQAGKPLNVAEFMGLQLLCSTFTATLTLIFFLLPLFKAIEFRWIILISGAAFGVGFFIPRFYLFSLIKRRKRDIQRALPDTMDLLSMCMEAGLGFEAALQQIAYKKQDQLGAELRQAFKEIRLGKDKKEVFFQIYQRTGVEEIRIFLEHLLQAEKLGLSVKDTLRNLAELFRTIYRQEIEEAILKTPVKLVFPLVLFIFPTLLIIILAPMLLKLGTLFSVG
jgi:tight adherence protein C